MANESIAWGTTPEDTDSNDGSQAYNLGREFTLTAEVPVVGVEWWVPDSLANPAGGPHAVSLWDKATTAQIAYREVTPTPGGLQQFIFDPADYDLGVVFDGGVGPTYVAAVYTNHYAFRSTGGSGAGSTSPSGTIVAGGSVLIPYNSGAASAPMPDQSSSANFYVSPIVALEETHTTSGAARALALATATTSTSRVTSASATATADAAAVSSTTRATTGSAAASAGATAVTSSTRATAASALALARASAATATVHATSGTARALALAAGYQAGGVAAPRLISHSNAGPIIARAQRA